MKNLIYQYFDKELPIWAKISSKMFKEYANSCNAEYLIETKCTFSLKSPYFEYLKLIYDKQFDEYDNILFCDLDVIPEKKDNIFKIQFEDIAMVAERQYPNMTAIPGSVNKNMQKAYNNALEIFKIKGIKDNGIYLIFNSGVILWSKKGRKKARKVFDNWEKWFNGLSNVQIKLDQYFINSQLNKLDYKELPLKWNCYPRVRWKEGYFPNDACFLHYTNKKKLLIEEIYK